ncbi:MAG TPA: response regulator [Candidatus Omnitrophota bacterium]|jgi:CheY-like chemotaxis protein|nr:response regulator [Candidatus Omnitrophota bacterium]
MPRILVVEDDASTLTMIRTGLSKAGYNVLEAHNGKDALLKIRLQIPDLILSDVYMPDMDGVDLLVAIRENPATKKIPIIIMTANPQMEGGFRKVGVSDFIPKPIHLDQLDEKIKKILSP